MKEDSHTQVKTCKICGKRAARYICQECGREVCEVCLEPRRWICIECYKHLEPEAASVGIIPWPTPLKLFLLGFFLIFIGMTLVIIAAALSGTSANFGAIVFIGPIPIVVGAGPNAIWMIILAVAVTIVGVILFLLLRKQA